MGFFEKVFPKKATMVQADRAFRFLNGYTPVFSTYGGSVYESELIRSALDAHGRFNAKLQPTYTGTAKPALMTSLMIKPNQWMTWPKFNYRLTQILYSKNNAFIVPIFGKDGQPVGITPICPQKWELLDVGGEPWLRFWFSEGKKAALELKWVGILPRFQLDNELFGEDNEALRSTLDLINLQKQGIEHGIKNSANYRFMATSTNFTKDGDLRNERERFDENNFSKDRGGGGILLFPNTYKDIKQLDHKPFTVDADQMKLIQESVMNYYGINLDVIQGKAVGDSWLAFYESSVEWFALNVSEIVTNMLFTENEIKRGNRFFLTANRLQYLSNQDKLTAISTFADRGLMTRNELREILNLTPLPEPWGNQIPARGEYYNVNEEVTEPDEVTDP